MTSQTCDLSPALVNAHRHCVRLRSSVLWRLEAGTLGCSAHLMSQTVEGIVEFSPALIAAPNFHLEAAVVAAAAAVVVAAQLVAHFRWRLSQLTCRESSQSGCSGKGIQ